MKSTPLQGGLMPIYLKPCCAALMVVAGKGHNSIVSKLLLTTIHPNNHTNSSLPIHCQRADRHCILVIFVKKMADTFAGEIRESTDYRGAGLTDHSTFPSAMSSALIGFVSMLQSFVVTVVLVS